MGIVTGPSIDIATKLIGRLKNIFGTRFVSFFAIKRQLCRKFNCFIRSSN